MSESTLRTDGSLEAQPRMGVRNLHNFIYCPRLFYFQWVENIFQENADTVAGSHVHRNVDAPSKLETPRSLVCRRARSSAAAAGKRIARTHRRGGHRGRRAGRRGDH